jgi:hypothetical protein
MVRSRRLILPVVGALALAVAAGVSMQAKAAPRGGVTLVSPSPPITVAPRGNVAVTVQVPTNATSVTGVIKVGNKSGRQVAFNNQGGGTFAGTVQAPQNQGSGKLVIAAKRNRNTIANGQFPVTVTTGTQPPPGSNPPPPPF